MRYELNKMDVILAIVTIAGFMIALAILSFTSQGAEMWENIAYHTQRLITLLNTAIPLARSNKAKNLSTTNFIDRSQFVRDVTIQDGTKVNVGKKFRKVWEIQNIGNVPWENRYLAREGPCEGPGRLKSTSRTRIPRTLPGQRCQIGVDLVAPPLPGSCYAEWKMINEHGRYMFPDQDPLFVSIDVVD